MKQTQVANHWIIYAALGSLELDEAMHGERGIDADDEASVRTALRDVVAPDVARWKPYWRERLRVSLAYFVHKPDVLEYRVLASLQDLTMPEPTDTRRFFEIMWDVLWPNSAYCDVNLQSVVEDNDVMELNEIRRDDNG